MFSTTTAANATSFPSSDGEYAAAATPIRSCPLKSKLAGVNGAHRIGLQWQARCLRLVPHQRPITSSAAFSLSSSAMEFIDLGRMKYRPAWERQLQIHENVHAGADETVLFVEHEPVITFGRRPGVARNLLASAEQLAKLGVEVVESDRGGDITFHGPGQLVVYPIIRLSNHKLSVSGYVHRLEEIIIDTLGALGIAGATTDPAAPGVWVPYSGQLAKVCAVGVRIRKGITMHGIALNVTTDLHYFDLIVPCGLVGRRATSLAQLARERAWSLDEVKAQVTGSFRLL